VGGDARRPCGEDQEEEHGQGVGAGERHCCDAQRGLDG
jgi:hypothetical protein